ncbi:alpha/beta fold hydrolase [Caballeronia cordobensis]|uniref:alpha/beta fold hydrolase n=1 Tax=Caballeronia cordobensis TaxID=1353886 RepID=UPI0006AD7019|nr:alpha/beta hydrolase [Caballeronia cordobensis]
MNVTTRNNVRVGGCGRVTMIFSHGFGCDQSMWRYVAPSFHDRYRTVLFDLVGSGGSDLSCYDYQKYGALDGYANDVLEILDQFADGPAVFVGHSVSAMIGMLATIRAPERFIANIMVGPSPSFLNDGDYVGGFTRPDIDGLPETLENYFLGWSSTMAPTIMGAPEQPELGQELANSFCRTDPDIAKHFARVTFLADHRADLTKVTTPTLIIQSDDDLLAPVGVGHYMHRAIADSRLCVVKNIGHCPHLSAPSASVDAMTSFLHALSA